jgi:hypothetical protein
MGWLCALQTLDVATSMIKVADAYNALHEDSKAKAQFQEAAELLQSMAQAVPPMDSLAQLKHDHLSSIVLSQLQEHDRKLAA